MRNFNLGRGGRGGREERSGEEMEGGRGKEGEGRRREETLATLKKII